MIVGKLEFMNQYQLIALGEYEHTFRNPIESLPSCHIAADIMNELHLDYRGLIEKGLALEAPEGMYNIKD